MDSGFTLWVDNPARLSLPNSYYGFLKGIKTGEDWQTAISAEIRRSDAVIAFWSHDIVNGKRFHFAYEVYQALIKQKLFQCVIDTMAQDEIGWPYAFRQTADLSNFNPDQNDMELQYLIKSICDTLDIATH
jgi:hypothetical protein